MPDRMVSCSTHQSPERHFGLIGLISCTMVNQHTVRYSAAKERKKVMIFPHVVNENLILAKSGFFC